MRIVEGRFDTGRIKLQETLFTQGNGYIGIRGNLEECAALEGNYINGFYETAPAHYEERKEGFAEFSETMLNITAAKSFFLTIEKDGSDAVETLDMTQGVVLSHRRELDMEEGVLVRETHWRSPLGCEIAVSSKRIVSFVEKHIIAITYEVTAKNFAGKITVQTGLDGDVKNVTRADDSRVGTNLIGQPLKVERIEPFENGAQIEHETKETKMAICCAMKVQASPLGLCGDSPQVSQSKKSYMLSYSYELKEGDTLRLTKFVAYAEEGAKDFVETAANRGFEYYARAQREYLDNFWQDADVVIDGAKEDFEDLQRSVRYGIFSLLQSAGRDGKTSIAAKGLSGEGYQGHYFWETEIYMLPVFLFTFPEIARSLLVYRYSTLDTSRKMAAAHLLNGAMYPWRTISGAESSPYYPAGTAQYHITGAIAYAINLYVEVSSDESFLIDYGAEMLFEIARMWLSLGHFNTRKGSDKEGKFCIDCVTGPDEYTTVVNNNCYTNIMAAENMQAAAKAYRNMSRENADKLAEISQKIKLRLDEVEKWEEAAEKMYLPYDEYLGIYMQDDSFLDRKNWDFEAHENKHLMAHFHPLVIYRAQVLKQADLLLSELLFPHRFTDEQINRDFEYYEPITSHDSSLSECIYGMIAARLGKQDEAMKHFMGTAFMDIHNTHNNTQDGLHMANMAGTWLFVIYGFAGLSVLDGEFSFKPYLPKGWSGYSFKLRKGKCHLKVEICENQATYTLLEGEQMSFYHLEKQYRLDADCKQLTLG